MLGSGSDQQGSWEPPPPQQQGAWNGCRSSTAARRAGGPRGPKAPRRGMGAATPAAKAAAPAAARGQPVLYLALLATVLRAFAVRLFAVIKYENVM